MATTIDKYVLETSVTGLKDVDALDTSVKTLGKSIDNVTSKKIAISLNATGFADLSTQLNNINTSLNTISTKSVKPTVSIPGLDQLSASMRAMTSALTQLNANNVNIKVDDSDVTSATNKVERLGSLIDKTDSKTISIKATTPTSLIGQNIDELKSSFASLSTGLLAGGVAAAATAITSLGIKAVETAGAITDLSEASGLSASEIYSLGDSIVNAGGAAGQNYDVINKLSMSIEDAATNGGKAAEAFKTLNVPIKDANGKIRDTSDVLRDVFEALGKTEDRTTRLSTAQELLGKANRNLKFEDIKFTDDTVMNTQIANTDSLGAAFDKLMQAVNKFSMAAVSTGADDAAGKVGTLTEYINTLTSIFNFATEKSDTFGLSLVDLAVKAAAAVNPLMAMVDLWKKGEAAVKYLRENVWQNKSDPLMAGNVDAIKSNPLGQSKGYQGRIKPFEVSPPKYDDSRFGVRPPKGGGGAGAADREAEARKRAREASDAQLLAMKLLQEEEQKIANLQVERIGLSKDESVLTIEMAQIRKTRTLDLAKVEAEITKEKQKGKDADKYIIDNLEKQKDLIEANAIAQTAFSTARSNNLNAEKGNKENLEKDLKDYKDYAEKIANIEPPKFTNDAINSEIEKFKQMKDAYLASQESLKAVAELEGYNSEIYKIRAAEYSNLSNVAMDEMDAQLLKIKELTQAEKDRTESFAGGWESAMKRMNDAMAPAQLGAQAYNDLWGNISSSIDTAVTTGKFKFADFRDSIISDLAKMASKALASKFTSWLLGSFISPIAGAGAGLAIGGDKGGSAFTRAKGGSVSGNQPYVVGERGPELFMPGQNGTIIPNRNLNEDKPQVVNQYTYNISAIDGNSVAKFFMDDKTMVAAANNAAKRERG